MENLKKEYFELDKQINDLIKKIALNIKNEENEEKIEALHKEYNELKKERTKKINDYRRKKDLELLERAIPKQRLEDGVWYDCDFEGKKVARFQGKAKWNKKREMFLAPGQQQFGTDGWLDHFEDVIDKGYAGFVPMWKVEE